MPMKYSICSVVYGGSTGWWKAYPLEETMRRLSGLGYDALELVCASPHAWPYYLTDKRIEEIKEYQKRYNIKFSTMMPMPSSSPGCNPASACPEERAWTIQYHKDVVDLAVKWDCKIVDYVAGYSIWGQRHAEAWENSRDTLKQVAEYAKERGVSLVIEPTSSDTDVVNTPDDAVTMIEQIGLPNIGCMFDTAHAFYRHEDPADYVRFCGDRLWNLHLCDFNRKAPGTAGFDFSYVMQAIKDVGYKGYVTMEGGFDHDTCPDMFAGQSITYLKQIEAGLK